MCPVCRTGRFLMALLWFASEFAYLKIPGWIYIIQAAINTVVLVGVFTAEHNPYFYNSMKILNDGMYQRINVSGGIIWKMHYIHMAAVLLTIQICCGVRYRQSTATQKKKNPLYSSRKRNLCLRTDIKRRRSLWQLQSGGMCYDHYDVLYDDGNGKIRLLRFPACGGRQCV